MKRIVAIVLFVILTGTLIFFFLSSPAVSDKQDEFKPPTSINNASTVPEDETKHPTNEKDGGESVFQAVEKFGNLLVGESYYQPGDPLGHSYRKIPPSRFYVYVYQNDFDYDFTCIFDECGYEGGIVSPLKGWLMGGKIFPSDEHFGLSTNNKGVFPNGESSLLVIADADSKMRKIYVNAKMENLVDILKLHTDLVNFDVLKGISRIGPLEVGGFFPPLMRQEFDDMTDSGEGRGKFSVYLIWNKLAGGGCQYYECGAYIWFIDDLGGDYFDIGPYHRDGGVIDKMGLSPSQVADGETSLMILSDSYGTIVGLHPNTSLRDIVGILMQYPELVDVSEIDN